jgi:cell division protein FtsW (lipid II flippase)
VFILLTVYATKWEPARFAQAMTVLAAAAAGAAVISVPLWYTENPFPSSRIVGIGTLDNPNPSSFVYGFFALLSCQLALTHGNRSARLAFMFSTLLLGGYVVLTQSDTGILAMVFSIALLLLLRSKRKRRHLIGGLGIAAAAVVFLASSIGMLERPMDTGLSNRIPIWQTVIKQIEQAPVAGNGYQKQVALDAQGSPDDPSYAHSALLASARDGGLIGAALHVLILIIALSAALRYFRQTNDPIYLAYLLFGFTCMLVDTDQLITRPRELWVIFWLPMAMIIATRTSPQAVRTSSGNQPVK